MSEWLTFQTLVAFALGVLLASYVKAIVAKMKKQA